MLNKRVHAESPGEQPIARTRNAVAVKIVDEPAQPCSLLHPAKERYDVLFGKVVREQRTQDQIGRAMQVSGEGIAGKPSYSGVPRRKLACCPGGMGVHINAREIDLDGLAPGPSLDTPEHVTASASDIDDVQRLRVVTKLPQPPQRGTVVQGEPVRETQRDQARPELCIRARFIHPLREEGTAIEIQAFRRHEI